MEDKYPYKLWLGILFVVFGIIFLLRDYGVFNFSLEHLPFLLVIVGVAFLIPGIKKAEKYIEKNPTLKKR